MSTVNVIALKPFIYSKDGYTEIPVSEKQVFDLPEQLFAGLNKAAYVRRAQIGDGHVSLKPGLLTKEEIVAKVTPIVDTAVKLQEALNTIAETGKLPVKSEDETIVEASDVEIPDDWRTFKFFALRSLATKLGASVKTMDEAVAAIETEIARRG